VTDNAGEPAAATVNETAKDWDNGFAVGAVTVTVPWYVPGCREDGLTLTTTVAGALPDAGFTVSQFSAEDTTAVKLSELAAVKTDRGMVVGRGLC
jgi:hypothetical protein